jgi:hypothetical protein
MGFSFNARLIEQLGMVDAMGPVVPASANPVWVSLKRFDRVCVLIFVKNGVTVTGAAIALQQAQNVSGLNAKPLNFSQASRKLAVGPGGAGADVWTQFAVTGNTFTTDNTNSVEDLYAIEIGETDLDINNGFRDLRVTVGNGVATTIGVLYLMFPTTKGPPPSAIVD